MMGKYHNERDAAQNEYLASQQDIANTTKQNAEELNDFGSFTQDTDKTLAEQGKKQSDLYKSSDAPVNQLNKDINAEQQAKAQWNREYSSTLSNKISQKTAKSALVNGYMQIASEEAKMKYQLASQRLAQAQSQWNTFKTVFQGAGAVAKLFGPWGMAIGLALDGIGAAGAAIGKANV